MSFPSYNSYKDSDLKWLGKVPSHWSIGRFKRIFEERNERSGDAAEQLLSVSAYTGVSPRSEIIAEGDPLTRAESLEGYKVCYPDDLVMNIMLAWSRGLGFSQFQGIVSPAYCVFRIIDDSSPKFLDYLVRSNECTLYFKMFSAGVIDSRLRLYPDVFRSLFCAKPPLSEQIAIAAFLDRETAKIDALVDEQKRLIDLLKEKRQAVIAHAITKGLDSRAAMRPSGVEWLGEVPAHWEVVAAKRIASVFVPQRNKPDLNAEGDGFPWVTMELMGSQVVRSAQLYVSRGAASAAGSRPLAANAVIASCVGTFGVASINEVDVIINQQLQAFVPGNAILPEFLRLCVELARPYFEMVGTAATLAYVNQQGFENLPICLPALPEQRSILQRVKEVTGYIDQLAKEAGHAVAVLQERRSALISAAVTGKIDVRDWVPQQVAAE
ncbi:restriction endonuclease subunit S [Mesorhizobium sp. M0306]|uniref:restriction endonuclease subunit S n=1 Tax=Mesorhizobium sp. M0306 TaxID=2956932 RepID=UPI003339B4E4